MSADVTEWIAGNDDRLLLLCDHASNAVPVDIALGIDPALLDLHIAVDIGAGALTRSLAAALDAPAILATVSRLVIDLHREPEHPGLIPLSSDGHVIHGNHGADPAHRLERFHIPYHASIEDRIASARPDLIVAVHSFTPRLQVNGSDRPWQVGILYNGDDRAAAPAIALLRARGIVTGDNEPYSGKELNATLNRHGEANHIPSIAVEVRNDLIRDEAGVARWSNILAQVVTDLRNMLA